jgi:uncharacterized protein YaeQ
MKTLMLLKLVKLKNLNLMVVLEDQVKETQQKMNMTMSLKMMIETMKMKIQMNLSAMMIKIWALVLAVLSL